jgi:hypothetical protein
MALLFFNRKLALSRLPTNLALLKKANFLSGAFLI